MLIETLSDIESFDIKMRHKENDFQLNNCTIHSMYMMHKLF